MLYVIFGAILLALAVLFLRNRNETVPHHVQALQALDPVDLPPIERLSALNDITVWVSHDSSETAPSTYHDVFWEIESWGQYLYYVAGDYSKNERGLLRFPTASAEFRVEVSFETDVIGVARSEYAEERQLAESGGELPKGKVLADIAAQYDPTISDLDWRIGFASLPDITPSDASGSARVVFMNNPHYKCLVARF